MILCNLYKGLSFFDIFNWVNLCELEHGKTDRSQILLNCVWKFLKKFLKKIKTDECLNAYFWEQS